MGSGLQSCSVSGLCLKPFLGFAGKSKTKENRQSIINPDWNFEKMGIGGLDKEFSDIFRRAFASRVFPPEIVEQMGEYDLEECGWGRGCRPAPGV